jgi:cell fate regulator YaaT (PSP1 superfamily)
MILMVPVKLTNGKSEECSAEGLSLEAGDSVIVESDRGLVLGKVLSPPHEKEKRFILKTPAKVVR